VSLLFPFARAIAYGAIVGTLDNNLTIDDDYGIYNYQDSFFMRAEASF
jgi:hypothetical protein